MVEVIALGREHGYERLEQAIQRALVLGCSDAEAIRYLLLEDRLERAPPEAIDSTRFTSYDRPLPALTDYDRLLEVGP